MATCFVHHYCLLPQFFSVQSSHIPLVAIQEFIASLLVFKHHMVDAKPYLTFLCQITAMQTYMNCSSNLSYLILSSHAGSDFFVSIMVGLYVPESSISSPQPSNHVVFQCLSQKKLKRLKACLVHLLSLVQLVCLHRGSRKIKVRSQGRACFPCCCSPCSSI
jgi:hypothetical protein